MRPLLAHACRGCRHAATATDSDTPAAHQPNTVMCRFHRSAFGDRVGVRSHARDNDKKNNLLKDYGPWTGGGRGRRGCGRHGTPAPERRADKVAALARLSIYVCVALAASIRTFTDTMFSFIHSQCHRGWGGRRAGTAVAAAERDARPAGPAGVPGWRASPTTATLAHAHKHNLLNGGCTDKPLFECLQSQSSGAFRFNGTSD